MSAPAQDRLLRVLVAAAILWAFDGRPPPPPPQRPAPRPAGPWAHPVAEEGVGDGA